MPPFLLPRRPSSQSHTLSPPARTPSSGSTNMASWHDAFDFSASYPLNSALHMPVSPGPHPLSYSPPPSVYADHIPSLERDFCSNFTCCGLSIGDLHELLEHFEEAHVVVFDANGNPIYPGRKTSTPSDDPPFNYLPSSRGFDPAPHSSVVLGYPQPEYLADAVSPFSTTSPTTSTTSTYGLEHFPVSPSTTHTTCDFSDRDMEDRDVLNDADAFETDRSSDSRSSPAAMSGLPPSSFTAPSMGRPSTRRGPPRKLKSRMTGSERRRHGHSRHREKMFRCPHEGCTKSYKNPNGLTYHLKKGTCKIEPTLVQDD
ncbi:hypothetical protein PLICRDRAFT_337571 [Plicaturopsis crispa FD-325 SS-3]|uniref:C2H2-type domain-containing protein n=1 Tax=Plicaturopsis crispa FD-325 SS-3 TaxID=944288 RepID=A0A0C9SLC7_PLICR|nr:hypothetical protein PLICRDRAFT_337571 [Plicaturopsis crispa FD-325 SS-3]